MPADPRPGKERRELLRTSENASVERVRQLLALRPIGINSAWLFVMEFLDWREFRNRRQVGAPAGLVGSPFSSGETNRELGISKAGNRHIQSDSHRSWWCWLRFQPQSELARWYARRSNKVTDLSQHGEVHLNAVALALNTRPRKTPDWRTPAEGLDELLRSAHTDGVATTS
jgi:transposase